MWEMEISMDYLSALAWAIAEHWQIWVVTVVLILAAVIDGFELKVPNWITLPMVISGWRYSTVAFGWEGLLWSLMGTAMGLALLLPAYAIGGMGAGDVKLLAGVGAWIFASHTFYAFCVSSIVGAVLAVSMVLYNKAWQKHSAQFWMILSEVMTIRNPTQLSTIAGERKSTMLLLPYGIPIAIGTIGYFFWMGMLI